MTKPEILFLAHRIPYPPDKGDKIRSWAWLKHLASRFRVHLACFVDEPEDFTHADFLSDLCETAALVPLNQKWSRVKSLRALAEGQPLSFRYFHHARMEQAVAAARTKPLAAEFAFSSAMAPYIEKPAGDSVRIVDFCDADSEKWLQYAENARGPMSWIYRREGGLLKSAETRFANWAHASLAISPEEASVFNGRANVERPVLSIPNGVDTEFFNPVDIKPENTHDGDIVFTGAMDYHANVEGVLHFLNAVWPQVRAQRPDAKFAIVGANPVSKIAALNGKNGVLVTGRVDDVRPWLAGAKLAVAPLRVARGVQNKVLEAMAMAKPVVASTEAMTGINAPANAAHAASNPDAMAKAVLSLLNDRDKRASIGIAARRFVEQEFSWRASYDRLDDILSRLGVYSSSPSSQSEGASSSISATR